MGLLDLLFGKGQGHKGKKYKCPNCGADVYLDMERCPNCGVRIKSMFKKKCPKCETLNSIDAKKCEKCGYDFEAELLRASKSYYVCPICGYKMETIMTRCPACGTKFM